MSSGILSEILLPLSFRPACFLRMVDPNGSVGMDAL